MPHKKETRKRIRPGGPHTQNPGMNVVASPRSFANLVSLKGPSVASFLENSDNTQNKHNNKNNISYNIIMNKNNLSRLTKNQLIELILTKERPVPKPRTKKVTPIPFPRKSVKQMVQNYEDTIIKPPKQFMAKPKVKKTTSAIPLVLRNNIIPPPKQFMDKPIVPPRTKKIAPTTLPRTEITETARAFQGYTKSYQVGIKNETDPMVQMSSTRLAIAHFMKQLLPQMKGLKFIETLSIYFEQKKGNEIVSRMGYFNSKPKTIINADDLAPFLDVNVEQIMEDIHKWISQGSAWIIKSIEGHYINIIQYEPLAGSSYIKLPTELQHHRKGLINLQNKDNECFRWCHIRHLNPQENFPQRIKKLTNLLSNN